MTFIYIFIMLVLLDTAVQSLLEIEMNFKLHVARIVYQLGGAFSMLAVITLWGLE